MSEVKGILVNFIQKVVTLTSCMQYPSIFSPYTKMEMRLCDRVKKKTVSDPSVPFPGILLSFVYLTLARAPVLSKLILASGSSLEDLRVSE